MFIALSVVSYLFVVLVFLPLVKDNFWLFRTLEYPRFQKFIIVLALLFTWIAAFFFGEPDLVAISLLGVSAVYLFIKIFPYTPMSGKEVATLKAAVPADSIKLFTANVYQDNREYERMLEEIKRTDPDVILLVETDRHWADAVNGLRAAYPFYIGEPLDNTYGLVFYSRFPLVDEKIVHLVKSGIPSLDTKVKLPSGRLVQLYGLHPEPPVPGESLTSTAKDKELMKVAFKVKKCKIPCIVLGDLNDVAWSYTTSLFTRVSGLLDVRCGRGFYSTFSARSRFFRFPLDYIFCSPDFGLFSMYRLPANGSDHFPIFTHLVYSADLKPRQQKKNSAGTEEEKEASEMAAQPQSEG